MGIVTIDRSANKMYTHALLVLAMARAAECAPERAYGYGHHETTTTTTMKPEPYKKHDNTFYHRPSYKSYSGYNSYHNNNEYNSYHHMEPRINSPYHSYQTYASPVYHTSYGYHNLHKRSPTFGNVQIDLPTAALIKAAAVAGAGKGLLPAGTFTVAGTALALGR